MQTTNCMTKSTQINSTNKIQDLKVAILHDFLVQFGGAEKTLEAMVEVLPNADIFTAKFDPKITNISPILKSHFEHNKIIYPKYTWVNKISKYFFTFIMAPVFESFDFKGYDIVISEGTAWPKGALTKPEQLHISYIHTPPRFLYGYSTESTKRNKWYFKLFFSYIDNLLRLWDFVSAQRPDFILTNSEETKKRIQKFYRRDAKVIYPPVEVETHKIQSDRFSHLDKILPTRYYLVLGRLAAYKNFDAVIKAFNQTDLNLVVIGTGTCESDLKKFAHNNITFVGRVNDKEKDYILNKCQGVINAVIDEDFGIVPIEAMAHGKPVLAYKSGGHLESVKEGINGMFFNDIDTQELVETINVFNKSITESKYDENIIRQSVQRFSKKSFEIELEHYIQEKWNDKIRAQ